MKAKLHGVVYEYEVSGQGEALLLLHGFTGRKEVWQRFVPSWSEHHRVIAVDLLGHGRSESPAQAERYDICQAAADMIALLDHLEVEKVTILGYSMGGRLALTIACLYPERVQALLLENCTAGLENEQERLARQQSDEQLAEFIVQQGIEAFVERWEKIPLFSSQKQLPVEIRERIREQRLQNNPAGLAGSLRGMGTGVQPSWWSKLPQLQMPILLLAGEYDVKFQAILQRMQKQLPQAELVQISQAGHAIHVEQPEKFDTIVKGFLQKEKLEGGLFYGF